MSIDIDTTLMFQIASDLFAAFWPVAAVAAGFALGFGVLAFVMKAIKGALPT